MCQLFILIPDSTIHQDWCMVEPGIHTLYYLLEVQQIDSMQCCWPLCCTAYCKTNIKLSMFCMICAGYEGLTREAALVSYFITHHYIMVMTTWLLADVFCSLKDNFTLQYYSMESKIFFQWTYTYTILGQFSGKQWLIISNPHFIL